MLCIIDIYSCLRTCYFDNRFRPVSKEKMLVNINKLVEQLFSQYNPKYICAVQNHGTSFPRKKLYKGYEADNFGLVEDKTIVTAFLKYFETSGISMIEKSNCENYDLIGTIAALAKNQNIEVGIISNNGYFRHVIDENTSVLKFINGKFVKENIPYILNREKIRKIQDIKEIAALAGDGLSFTPFTTKISPSRAESLIYTYGTIENLYKNITNFQNKFSSVLKEHKVNIALTKKFNVINRNLFKKLEFADYKISKELKRKNNTFSLYDFTEEEKNKIQILLPQIRLKIQMIPVTSFYKNVRSNIAQTEWDRIRRDIYKQSNYECDICKGKGDEHPVECHELWDYDSKTRVQKLVGFQSICPSCHEVIHIGRTSTLGTTKKEKAYEHFKTINNLNDEDAKLIANYFKDEWITRCGVKWSLNLDYLINYGIQHVQETAILTTDKRIPTLTHDDNWVYSEREVELNHPQKFRTSNGKNGKWLIFVDVSELDSTWEKVENATKAGILGPNSKAATSKSNPNAITEKEKVICVYTYNWLDTEDVFRVEKALRSIGITQTLYYKADSDTALGNYKKHGNTGISKYISKGSENYEKYSLEALSGVGYSKIQTLNNIGINNFDDLLKFDTSRKFDGKGVSSGYLNKLKLMALSKIEERIFKMTPFQFPQGDIVHFDIETDVFVPDEHRRVWSIALHHKNNVVHFYAETWDKEKQILTEFLKYLKSCKEAIFFSYSSFDVRVLKYALKRHKLNADFFLNLKHYDMLAILKQNFIFPTDGYSVKQIGKYMGYKFKAEQYDGLTASFQYSFVQNTKKKPSKELINYIKDDVKVMHHIFTKIQKCKNIKELFDHHVEVKEKLI